MLQEDQLLLTSSDPGRVVEAQERPVPLLQPVKNHYMGQLERQGNTEAVCLTGHTVVGNLLL